MVAPVLLKYRVCKPRLLLAGSRAEVDTAADVALLVGEVLLIEDSARQYHRIGGKKKLIQIPIGPANYISFWTISLCTYPKLFE